MNMELCQFAKRHLDPEFPGTKIYADDLPILINLGKESHLITEGYAPFCKIVAISNKDEDGNYIFPHLKLLTIEREWALKNGAQIKTAYEARTPEELAILTEWVEDLEAPVADWLHLILYSKEQLNKEDDFIDADWGIVSIQTSPTSEVEPMRPITAMRNALGVAEGGSGVVLDHEEYRRSVDYWQKHISLR